MENSKRILEELGVTEDDVDTIDVDEWREVERKGGKGNLFRNHYCPVTLMFIYGRYAILHCLLFMLINQRLVFDIV